MTKKNLEKTSNAMKDVLADAIDDLTQVAKKGSKGIFTAILEQGAENVGELFEVYGDKLKKKVQTHGKTNDKKK